MIDETAAGVFTIAVTPFLPDGAVDWSSVDSMVDFYISKGATGLTILGMMGEAGKLTAEESLTIVERVVARSSVSTIVGVSAAGFVAMKTLADAAMDAGAVGVMVAPPSNLRTDDQIVAYYHNVADVLGVVPFVLQDFPLVTNVIMSPSVILKIIEDCPTCMMLKHEDWPGLEKISTLRAASDGGARRISVMCGNGGLYLLEEMLRGADGAMTGFAYPEMMSQVIEALNNNEGHARNIFDAYMPMIRYEAQPGIGLAIRKYTLAQRGAIAYETLRKPSVTLSAIARSEIDTLAARQKVKLKEINP
ncbi:MAG: 4-hydroxy-tetrahydrodipicolinate synthase [Alteromonas macleodii]|jgi:4-hydroxy-tetrahydrodipicolinate synthase